MAGKYLGDSFDIHGGGVDLRFPHHENEQAQSRASGRGFARTWMHHAWITTSGEKMSKSLGNSLVVSEVIKRVRPVELRYYMLNPHYRSMVEFSFEALDEAGASYRRVEGFLARAGRPATPGSIPEAFVDAMNDDFGTPAAIAVLHDTVRAGNKALAAGDSADAEAAAVVAMLDVLGLDPADPAWGAAEASDLTGAVDVLVANLLQQRAEARAAKDWAAADAVRDTLKQAGIAVEDTPDGPKWSVH